MTRYAKCRLVRQQLSSGFFGCYREDCFRRILLVLGQPLRLRLGGYIAFVVPLMSSPERVLYASSNYFSAAPEFQCCHGLLPQPHLAVGSIVIVVACADQVAILTPDLAGYFW